MIPYCCYSWPAVYRVVWLYRGEAGGLRGAGVPHLWTGFSCKHHIIRDRMEIVEHLERSRCERCDEVAMYLLVRVKNRFVIDSGRRFGLCRSHFETHSKEGDQFIIAEFLE